MWVAVLLACAAVTGYLFTRELELARVIFMCSVVWGAGLAWIAWHAPPTFTVWLVARRNLAQHGVATVIGAISIALGCGLVMATYSLSRQTELAFTGGDVGFDAVVGARGSQLQLVLNTVYHLETSPGNVPYSTYLALKEDRRVKLAIPYAVGDNYLGYRIVGTVPEMLSTFEYQRGKKLTPRAPGRVFDPTRREAVIGATVARETGLVEGKTFRPYHGLDYKEGVHQHPIDYLVVGVLEPTNSPNDRVVWIPIEGVWRMEGHVLVGANGSEYTPEEGAEIPDAYKELSAVMLELAGPMAGFSLAHDINRRGKQATIAWPIANAMAELFRKIGWVVQVLALVANLVVVVALASLVATLYGTMHQRRRELAILRALGARRAEVMSILVLEAGATATLGALLAFAVHAGVLAIARWVVLEQTGVVIDVLAPHPVLYVAPGATIVLGALAGLLPGIAAYRSDVASNIGPTV